MHAKYSPSSLHRIFECPQSYHDSLEFEDKSSRAAQEGTAAHALFELMWKDGPNDKIIGEKIEGIKVNKDMFHYIHDFYKYIDEYRQTPGNFIWVEKRVHIKKFPDIWGTADVIIYTPSTYKLRVIDLKYGKGVKVAARDNLQLSAYAMGAIDFLAPNHIGITYTTIYQPRMDNIDSWCYFDTDIPQLEKLFTEKLTDINDHPFYTPGTDACMFCPAKKYCVPRQQFDKDKVLEGFTIKEQQL